MTKRKTFISYYHYDDQYYKEKFIKLFGDLIVNKSVEDGDIDGDNSDTYIKQLIQKGHLEDTTVLIVLVGAKTKCRKHVDWEISGALNLKVGDHYSGLVGILLPSHPDYGKKEVQLNNLPKRLADNVKSDYAQIHDWTTSEKSMQSIINNTFYRRKSNSDDRVNSRAQMLKNTCS